MAPPTTQGLTCPGETKVWSLAKIQKLASLKPEISQAVDSLLDEIRINNDAKVLRTAFKNYNSPPTTTQRHPNFRTKNNKICPLCKQAGRPRHDHFLSTCKFLPHEDKTFMSRARHLCALTNSDEEISKAHLKVTNLISTK